MTECHCNVIIKRQEEMLEEYENIIAELRRDLKIFHNMEDAGVDFSGFDPCY